MVVALTTKYRDNSSEKWKEEMYYSCPYNEEIARISLFFYSQQKFSCSICMEPKLFQCAGAFIECTYFSLEKSLDYVVAVGSLLQPDIESAITFSDNKQITRILFGGRYGPWTSNVGMSKTI